MSENQAPKEKTVQRTIFMGVLAGFSAVYLLNPFFGFDLIPDNLPGVGNLDEAAAVALLLGALSYFGIDITRFIPFYQAARTRTEKQKSKSEGHSSDFIDIDPVKDKA